MMPCSHWPDRSIPFALETSEVIQFILANFECDINEADSIMHCAAVSKIIAFDPNAKLWRGTCKEITEDCRFGKKKRGRKPKAKPQPEPKPQADQPASAAATHSEASDIVPKPAYA